MNETRGSRALVTSTGQIAANAITLHTMAYGTSLERQFHKARVKNGKVFVGLEHGSEWIFAPSRFCGYVDNGLHHLDLGTYRHGSETNIAIRAVLGDEIGRSATKYTEIDSAYEGYCAKFGIEASVHQMERRYWHIEIDIDYPDEAEFSPGSKFQEGSAKQVLVNKYERSPEARRACISYYGVACSVCQFNFSETYGELGQDFIHVHHLRPLHTIKSDYVVDPIKDLRPVCPNCHAMLHRRKPHLTIEELANTMK